MCKFLKQDAPRFDLHDLGDGYMYMSLYFLAFKIVAASLEGRGAFKIVAASLKYALKL